MKEYQSLKHGRVRIPHEISFEHNRVMEGKPGEKHSLAPKPPTFLDRIKKLTRRLTNNV